jgi:hypothetical protein
MRIGLRLAAIGAFLALAAPSLCQALTITLDSTTVTVTQPTSGTVEADFTGSITGLLDGYDCCFGVLDALYNSSGDLLSGVVAFPTGNTHGVIFTATVDSSDFGLYTYDSTLSRQAVNYLAQCPDEAGGACDEAFTALAVNVVKPSAVPEPEVTLLVALVLVGIGMLIQRRRRRNL